MSLLWPKRLLISLAPGELSWLRVEGLVKSEVTAKGLVAVAPGYGAHAWDGTIAALRAATAQWSRDRLAVRVVLSNHFVRYALVPPSNDVSGHAEELALARFHFHKIHGDNSRAWDIRLSSDRTGRPRLAAAIDIALLHALQQSFPQDKRPRLVSVQPLLMSVFNNGSSLIPDNGAWLIMAEPDRACVTLLKSKAWHVVQNVKGTFSDVESWIALVERERWRVNLDAVPNTLLIHAAQSNALLSRTHGAWKVAPLQMQWPTGLLPSRDGAYIGALSAI